MKNTIKFLGIIAIIAIIGFTMAACDPDNGNGNGNGETCGTCNEKTCICEVNQNGLKFILRTFPNRYYVVNAGENPPTGIVVIPSAVNSIPVTSIGLFQNTGITDITLPESIRSIGAQAFVNSSSLTTLTVLATTPPSLGGEAFFGINLSQIRVPAGSLDTYKATSGWFGLSLIIVPIQ